MTHQDNHGLIPQRPEEVTPEDIEYLRLCLDAYTAAPLQDGMLQHYLSQASQSDAYVEGRLGKEGYDFRDRLGLPRK